jgi:hypothetical protein
MVVTAMHMLYCLLALWILLSSLVWRYSVLFIVQSVVACFCLRILWAIQRKTQMINTIFGLLFTHYLNIFLGWTCISAIRFSCIDTCYWRLWRCHNWLERTSTPVGSFTTFNRNKYILSPHLSFKVLPVF